MRRLVGWGVFIGLSVFLLVGFTTDVRACGDKFLTLGRGLQPGRGYVAPRSASILIFENGRSNSPTAISDPDLKTNLEMAGHKYQIAPDSSALSKALSGEKYDIILADIGDAKVAEELARGSASKPEVLPVLYNPTANDMAAARKDYGEALKGPAKTGHLLAVIDRVMKSRPSTPS